MAKIPFLDRLKRHREGRELDAHATVLNAARALAAEKQPSDVEAVDEALRTLGKDPEFLVELAEQFAALTATEQLAATGAEARAQLSAARAAATDLNAKTEREIQRLREAAAAADVTVNRAAAAFRRADEAEKKARDLRRAIRLAVNPAAVAAAREALDELKPKLARTDVEGARQRVADARRAVTETERALESAGGDALTRKELARLQLELAAAETELTTRERTLAALQSEQAQLEAALEQL